MGKQPSSRYQQIRELRKRQCRVQAQLSVREASLKAEIAERLRAEARISMVAREWQATFDASREAFWLLDKNQRVIRSNRAADEHYSSPCEGAIGQHCWTIAHGTCGPVAGCPVQIAKKTLQRATMEEERNGRLYLITANPLLDDAGQYAGAVHIISDITEQRRAEEALRASELQYRTLFESSQDAIMTLAPPSWKFTNGNPATLALFEVSTTEVFDALEPWRVSPEYQPDGRLSAEKAQEAIEIAMATGSHLFEWTHQRLGGETFPATVLLSRIEINGQAMLLATVRDMTQQVRAAAERNKLEEQLRVAQKMEAIGTLAGGVAHDFNNLLTVIQANTMFALEDVAPDSPVVENLQEIRQAGNAAAALTRQLLAFSRKQVLQPFPLDLNDVTRGITKMLKRLLREDIAFVHAAAEDLGLTFADPGQMEQVLMNLVINARDAMPHGGVLRIETANVEVDEAFVACQPAVPMGAYVQLAVIDNGCGMDDRTLERLFEPFFTTKEVGKGTGLGMSTVYGIVKQSGGAITVESALGIGTAVRIFLPREVAETQDADDGRAAADEATILLVEDVEALRKAVARALTAQGYRVLTAVDGQDALAVVAQHPERIDLLLTDVVMPNLGGRALAERMAMLRPETRVLFMSGYLDTTPGQLPWPVEADALLAKPFTTPWLLQKVRDRLAGRHTDRRRSQALSR